MIRRIAVVFVLLLVPVFVYRAEVVLFVAHHLIDAIRDIGPHREVKSPAERPPNIVLILADDMGWNDVSSYGGGAGKGSVKTPNIDSLASEGVSFTTGYAGNGTCASTYAICSGLSELERGFASTNTLAGAPPGRQAVRRRHTRERGSKSPRLRRGGRASCAGATPRA